MGRALKSRKVSWYVWVGFEANSMVNHLIVVIVAGRSALSYVVLDIFICRRLPTSFMPGLILMAKTWPRWAL